MTMTTQKLILTPYDTQIIGKINSDAYSVCVLLDSSLPFAVILPDVKATIQREIICKNIGANDVTIVPQNGQYFDLETSLVVSPLDTVFFWPDMVRTWWIAHISSSKVAVFGI